MRSDTSREASTRLHDIPHTAPLPGPLIPGQAGLVSSQRAHCLPKTGPRVLNVAKVTPLRVPMASPHRPCTFSQSFRFSSFLLLKWKGEKIHQYHLHHRHEGTSKATEASWICPCRGGSHHKKHPVVSLCHPFKPLGWDAEACQALRNCSFC